MSQITKCPNVAVVLTYWEASAEVSELSYKSLLYSISVGSYCSCKFDHQMAPLALVAKLATRWRHLHELQIWPQDGTTCISCNIDHQMAPLALVANLPTRWRYLHCFQS